jgi:UDP-N-acetylglucosamine 2-epimerase
MVLDIASPTWSSFSVEELDRFAWTAISTWHLQASVETTYNGLDYAELTRSFLWDKVPRAIRKQVAPERFATETTLLQDVPFVPRSTTLFETLKRPIRPVFDYGRAWRQRIYARRNHLPILFIPRAQVHLRRLGQTLVQSSTIALAPSFMESFHYSTGKYKQLQPQLSRSEAEFARALYTGILKGLQAFGIELLDVDQRTLERQILRQLRYVRVVEAEMKMSQPKAILVYADNHHPMQEFVFVAQRDRIPTIMLQHGLDCEHYCLDEAYADAIAVWGNARRRRYQEQSTRQPQQIQVTGNPQYDEFRLPEKLDCTGNYWLWVTRPHVAEKCQSPSRHVLEGVQILEALLVALQKLPDARLVIKPHPSEQVDLYLPLIERYHVSDRVEITRTNVHALLPQASVVISEDSTAGLEAMFFGKRVIHAHFASSLPTVSFVESGAALPGYSPEQLQESLTQIDRLTDTEQATLLEGMRQFLTECVGSLDGQATERVISFISDIVSK